MAIVRVDCRQGVGGRGDAHPGGCPCGESWLEQIETCREMGVVIHTVCCGSMDPVEPWKKIAAETWGQFVTLKDVASVWLY